MPKQAKCESAAESASSQRHTTPRALTMVAALSLSVAAHPALADVMSATEITERIVGKELVGRRMGMRVQLRYDVGGAVTIRAPFFSGTGSWQRDGDRLCMTVTGGPNPGTSCHSFEDLGGGRFRNSDGMVLQVQN